MQIHAARKVLTASGASRAGRCLALATLALLLGNKGLQSAVAEGDTRTISFHHIHTGEDLTVTYKRNGRYDEEALKKINHVLRDWRREEEIRMDPRLIDVVWEVYREVGATEPIQVVCGYRAPATNAMLRRRSRGVAQFSQHTLGRAMDFYIPGVSLERQREIGLRLQRGGVGYYPTSGSPFVHLDVGSVRHWPRMTHDQLARVFPDGRTVHIPSDGQPLRGYAVALADIEKRGSSLPSQTSLDAARNSGVEPARAVNVDSADKPRRSLLAALFGSKDEEEDGETAAAPARSPAPKAEKSKPNPRPAVQLAARTAPEVAAKPAGEAAIKPSATAFSVASADSQPVNLGEATRVANLAGVPSVARARVETTGTLIEGAPQWPLATNDAADRVPHDLALAYAAQAVDVRSSQPINRGLTVNAALPRNAATIEQPGPAVIAQPTTAAIVRKTVPAAAPAVVAAPMRAPEPQKSSVQFEDIWLRALVLAPDLQNYMTTTLTDRPDPRELRALMDKPSESVMMTFSDDPHLGMRSDRFSGNAVAFVSTVAFVSAPRPALAFRTPSVFLTP